MILLLDAPDRECVVLFDGAFRITFVVTANGHEVCDVGRFFGGCPEECGLVHVFVSEMSVAFAIRVE
ncbi:cytochrome c oxidase domain protein [Fibrobacter succinogenes subsp. succinogenes S85]|uniref:Cytochrome c oxidase domain protein n=1 Tax=Fibrobacter succinogenes (strain ATCC 19169 / S85) TaxID=59374 RepID=D9S788_FIBSS|nr:cytochrome c oxidase domain protein [Fibrobacter succinogenes subsp. succinogenes S85]